MMQAGERGLFIVVEGLDRSGKTTQCQKFVDNISSTGKEVKYVKFPGTFVLSKSIVLHCLHEPRPYYSYRTTH